MQTRCNVIAGVFFRGQNMDVCSICVLFLADMSVLYLKHCFTRLSLYCDALIRGEWRNSRTCREDILEHAHEHMHVQSAPNSFPPPTPLTLDVILLLDVFRWRILPFCLSTGRFSVGKLFVCWTCRSATSIKTTYLAWFGKKLVFTVGVSRQENFVLFTAGRAVGKKLSFVDCLGVSRGGNRRRKLLFFYCWTCFAGQASVFSAGRVSVRNTLSFV